MSLLSALSSISVAPISMARVTPRSHAVYSAILLVATPRYLYLRSVMDASSERIKTPHPAGPGFQREPPSVYTMSFRVLRVKNYLSRDSSLRK